MKINQKLNPYCILGLLILIFIAPLIAALTLYNQAPHWLHHKTRNKGKLISPPLDFNRLSKQTIFNATHPKPWSIVYLTRTSNPHQLNQALHRLHQIRLALGKNSPLIGITLIQIGSSPLRNNNRDITHYLITETEYHRFFTRKKRYEGAYLLDPEKKVILYYPVNSKDNDLYQDATHLLTQLGK